ncbi:epiphycan-like isoform X1 [Carassius auratus]|uniref:Epiphycan-like isoform X1 n=1 Tax=Carassius auratus TaxID=7957 RepID=A0A6P6L0H5_CARAU|nr:epiphycan-like isoform X1 [Carassius auratus]
MPSCLLCVCISGSVHCDDSDLTQIPPLPKETKHFYARFNKITEVRATDFININLLKQIDLSGNQTGKVNEDAFRSLLQLQDLMLADNNIYALPELPATLKHIDVGNNQLRSSGMHAEAFKNNNIQSMSQDTICNTQDKNKLPYFPQIVCICSHCQ